MTAPDENPKTSNVAIYCIAVFTVVSLFALMLLAQSADFRDTNKQRSSVVQK